MNQHEAQQFLQTHKQAVLATLRRDGRAQLSNITFAFKDGELWISTTEDRAKYRNMQRDPRVTLLVLGDNFYQYLAVDGTAGFVMRPDALPLLREYYQLAAGQPHPDWDEYDRAMEAERRVLMRVTVERLYPISE